MTSSVRSLKRCSRFDVAPIRVTAAARRTPARRRNSGRNFVASARFHGEASSMPRSPPSDRGDAALPLQCSSAHRRSDEAGSKYHWSVGRFKAQTRPSSSDSIQEKEWNHEQNNLARRRRRDHLVRLGVFRFPLTAHRARRGIRSSSASMRDTVKRCFALNFLGKVRKNGGSFEGRVLAVNVRQAAGQVELYDALKEAAAKAPKKVGDRLRASLSRARAARA